jgi:ferredoxin--NADP+ reductase
MNEEQGDLANYYDEKTFKAFQALSKPLIRSDEQALEQSLDDHSHEVWDLVQQSNTYVFLAGLDKIAAIFDRIMAQASGAESRWAACKRGLIEEKRWSELIYS